MPMEQAMQLYKEKRAIFRDKPTNAVITALKYVETPLKNRDIHPKDNYVRVDLSGAGGKQVRQYTQTDQKRKLAWEQVW